MAGLSRSERLAVIGDPIAHSLSPAMQGAALAEAGLPWTYEAVRVSSSELPHWAERVRSGEFIGFNVTIPHKTAILPFLDEVLPSARRTGAVNTVIRQDGRLLGHNTDLAGFAATLSRFDLPLAGRLAVVFGAGGAACAVVTRLSDLEARFIIVNRTLARAQSLAAQCGAVALRDDDPEVGRHLENAELLVNATSLGMGSQANTSPLPPGAKLHRHTIAIDLVYGHDTPFLQCARGAGCRTADGSEMLVQQGAESFRIWTGSEPNLDSMRRALGAHRGEVEHVEISHRR